MQRTLNRLFSRMLSNKGYTIDQTILIVAIIAILITLVIVTVGWQLINRAGGTKAGAQLKQVEDANGQFFSDQRTWPYQGGKATNNQTVSMQILNNTNAVANWADNIDQTRLKNLLPGFKTVGTAVKHNFGNGGDITQWANRYPAAANIGTDLRMVVQFAAVPLADAKEADRSIDGEEDPKVGRVLYGDAACLNTAAAAGGNTAIPATATGTTVFVCYAANTVG